MKSQMMETIQLLGEDQTLATGQLERFRKLQKDLSVEIAEELEGVIEAFHILNRRIRRALTHLNGEPMEVPHVQMT
jgi:hypothetical protein